jgi:hypothetical protein
VVSRSEHGMIALPRITAAKLERAYAIHRSTALVARACFNFELARHQAARTRALVEQFAKYPPFSIDTGRRYLMGVL